MNANKRRLVITLGPILFGSILIALDVPLVFLVVGTFAAGIVLISITDRGTTNDVVPKPFPKKGNMDKTSMPDSKIGKNRTNTMKATSHSGEEKEKKSTIIKTLVRKVYALLKFRHKKILPSENNSEVKIQKIDELLDSLIAEPSSAEPVPSLNLQKVRPQKEESSPILGIGPLKELTGAQIQGDLLLEEDESATGDIIDPSHDPRTISDKMNTQGTKKEGSQSLSEVPETDGEHKKDEQELPVTAIQVEQLDAELKSLEPHVEDKSAVTGEPKMTGDMNPGTKALVPQDTIPTANEKNSSAQEVPGPLPVSSVNDILHSLRSEVTQVKKTGAINLLRNLKDDKVSLIALKADLESISAQLSSLK
jgi:hypothetical protein